VSPGDVCDSNRSIIFWQGKFRNNLKIDETRPQFLECFLDNLKEAQMHISYVYGYILTMIYIYYMYVCIYNYCSCLWASAGIPVDGWIPSCCPCIYHEPWSMPMFLKTMEHGFIPETHPVTSYSHRTFNVRSISHYQSATEQQVEASLCCGQSIRRLHTVLLHLTFSLKNTQKQVHWMAENIAFNGELTRCSRDIIRYNGI
jgi:hypothetical protein